MDSSHFSQELRLASPANENFDYVVGLYYLDQDLDGDGSALLNLDIFTGGAVPIPDYTVGYDAQVDAKSMAAFAHANYKLTESLQLTGGIRYTKEEKEIDFSISDPFKLFFDNGATQDKRTATDLSPKISLNWFVNDDVMIFGGYSKAYKSGGFNADFIADISVLEFDDEKVDAYEIGIKSTWLDDSLRFNAAIFQSNHTDFQVSSATPVASGGSILTISNAGELTSQGIEMDIEWLLHENLRIWASYGYTDAEFDKYEGCTIGGTTGDCSGNRPTEAPKVSYNLGAEWFYMLDSGEIFANANYFWRDEMYSNVNNEQPFLNEDYSELSGRIGWNSEDGAYSVYLWGKNLTDEQTQIYNSVSFLGTPRSIYNAPRMYGVTFRWNFGLF
ncbi:TonB-dependent receptor [Colwellia sp. MEBiC06753]